MVVFRLVLDYRLTQKRFCQTIGDTQQPIDCFAIERIRHDEETVLGKRAALIGSEWHEVHQSFEFKLFGSTVLSSSFSLLGNLKVELRTSLLNYAAVLHLTIRGRQDRGVRK